MSEKKAEYLLSQHLDIMRLDRRRVTCGVVSLLMLMRYRQLNGANQDQTLPDLDKLDRVGVNRRAYKPGQGWSHSGLVGLAKIYGFKRSCSYDLADRPLGQTLTELRKHLNSGPVIASVYFKYRSGQGGHLLVLEQLTRRQVTVWDPDSHSRSKIRYSLSAERFLPAWKKRFIVIY